MEKQNIVYKSTSDLIPYIRNSRTHDDKQAVLESIGATFDIIKNG